MARIDRAEYPTIVRLVDVEHRKVADVADRYDCTPAAIYALLARARKEGIAAAPPARARGSRRGAAAGAPAAEVPAASGPAMDTVAGTDLFAAAEPTPPQAAAAEMPAGETAPPAAPPTALAPVPVHEAAAEPAPAGRGVPEPATPVQVTSLPPRSARRERGVGARLARPGAGLVMRTDDGEETMTPFRTIEDLLAAIRPILRSAARSPDPVWFSIQPIDLASIETDAA